MKTLKQVLADAAIARKKLGMPRDEFFTLTVIGHTAKEANEMLERLVNQDKVHINEFTQDIMDLEELGVDDLLKPQFIIGKTRIHVYLTDPQLVTVSNEAYMNLEKSLLSSANALGTFPDKLFSSEPTKE